MVAGIRHEMVHARLMRLTLQQMAAWKQNPGGLTFSQFVDSMKGGDGALVKDRFFGGHMDETVAYAEGFLTAFFYAPVEAAAAGRPRMDRPSRGLHDGVPERPDQQRADPEEAPKGIADERNLAIRQGANAAEAGGREARQGVLRQGRSRRSARTWRRGCSTSTRPAACTGPRWR